MMRALRLVCSAIMISTAVLVEGLGTEIGLLRFSFGVFILAVELTPKDKPR
jgi:hypothetical protein